VNRSNRRSAPVFTLSSRNRQTVGTVTS
jgi:hypothetical protein